MQVSNISLVTSQADCQLQAEVRTAQAAEPFLLWYRFPAAWAHAVSINNGDPFVLALLHPAMTLGEPLEIPAPVSSRLACSVPELEAIYRIWDPTLTEIAVHAPIRREQFEYLSLPSHVGLFFSLGVDSFYSLFKNIDLHSFDDESITDLITVHGFDISAGRGNASLFPTVLENSRKVGMAVGKNVLPVSTNIRELSDRYQIEWSFYHGAAMASVGLAHAGAFRKIWCADAFNYANLHLHGTNPLFAPLWSSERLTFVIDGCTTTKLGKIRYFAGSPLAQETLRVCWENPGNAYNCGRCSKCLLTMIGLHVAGVLPKFKTFPSSIDINLISTQVATTEDTQLLWKDLVGALGTSKVDLEIKVALESHLGPAQASPALSMENPLATHTAEGESLSRQLSAQTQKVNALVSQYAERQPAVESLAAQLAEQTSKVSALVAQVGERQQTVQTLAAQLAEKEQSVQHLSHSLNMIYSSKLWRIGTMYRSVFERTQLLWKPKAGASTWRQKG